MFESLRTIRKLYNGYFLCFWLFCFSPLVAVQAAGIFILGSSGCGLKSTIVFPITCMTSISLTPDNLSVHSFFDKGQLSRTLSLINSWSSNWVSISRIVSGERPCLPRLTKGLSGCAKARKYCFCFPVIFNFPDQSPAEP